jgi:UDP-N-acetylglucosamine 2-epimerase (non-hydrolysing)
MSEVFKLLDKNFNHILIHTGQHYDKMLSDVFFNELKIRKPDYNLEVGGAGLEHFHQTATLSVKLIELIRKEFLRPDLILFLGDSNSVTVSMMLKKEGYRIGHIEAGMRSGDKRMLEEINRMVCDHCSDLHFVYHDDYKTNLIRENLPSGNIYVVGNTIVEVCNKLKYEAMSMVRTHSFILMDIHRPENFRYRGRLENIMRLADKCVDYFGVPVKFLKFHRTMMELSECNIPCNVDFVDLMSYKDFLRAQYNCLFMISDSGTAQEEPALLGTPVIVPRDYTERPQSVMAGCSLMVDVNEWKESIFNQIDRWLNKPPAMDTRWLGDGKTSEKIINVLKERV